MKPLRLATRRSALATTQATWVARALAAEGHPVELVPVVTEGDVDLSPLTEIGGTGVFAAAVRHAVLDGRADLAVHSLKDLPTAPVAGLVLAAVPAREDPRDVLVARAGGRLADLPPGARVGTGSPRRAAQLRLLRPDVEAVPVRGNVDTRLRLVAEGEVDAVILALSGLARLDRLAVVSQVISPADILPAAGQGALAVECRADRADVRERLAVLEDETARACVEAERALLVTLEAGCIAPVGALAMVTQSHAGIVLNLAGFVGRPDGSSPLRRSMSGSPAEPVEIGTRLGRLLLDEGAGRPTHDQEPHP